MRASTVLPAGSWDPAREEDRIEADHHQRHLLRILLRTQAGHDVLLDLAHATQLRDGDAVVTDEGVVVRIAALPEQLLEITASSPAALLRLAWHLGNRHLPAALAEGRLLIRDDHVIRDMVRGLGGSARPVSAPFDPETGAYDAHHHG